MANDEWYTPHHIVDAARSVMGCIDLDPASCAVANRYIGAASYYTKETNGLAMPWAGKVWLNPPYSRGLIDAFVEKLSRQRAYIECAIVIVNAATATRWFHRLLNMANSICLPTKRVRFIDGSGCQRTSPRHSQAIMSIGCDPRLFSFEFRRIGRVLEVVP